jgi:hypothetical protein
MTTPSLPMDIMGHILSYCHAKTIHTFLMTAIASNKERSKIVLQVVRVRYSNNVFYSFAKKIISIEFPITCCHVS